MGNECDVDEILRQMKVLDNLRQLRENMGSEFMKRFPELQGLDTKLDKEIGELDANLTKKVEECGSIDRSEIPETLVRQDSEDLFDPEEIDPEDLPPTSLPI